MLGRTQKNQCGVSRVDAFVGRMREGSFAAQVRTRQRTCFFELFRRAVKNNSAAVGAGSGTHINNAVGREHHLRVVFDDNQSIAGAAQAFHDGVHAVHILRMQTDRRLIENEQCIDQRSAESGGQVNTLNFSAGERAALTVKIEVTETDFREVTQAGADFVEQHAAAFFERRRKFELIEEDSESFDREQHQVTDIQSGQIAKHGIGESCVGRAPARMRA